MPSNTVLVWSLALFTMMTCIGTVDSLRCLEGADCLKDASCEECDGVACTRIISFSTEDNKEVALTCLPHDTRLNRPALLEEDGCRHFGDRQMCVCYDRDYCNSKHDKENVKWKTLNKRATLAQSQESHPSNKFAQPSKSWDSIGQDKVCVFIAFGENVISGKCLPLCKSIPDVFGIGLKKVEATIYGLAAHWDMPGEDDDSSDE